MKSNEDSSKTGSPIECRRCGTCCRKYQAIVDRYEIRKIADHLGMTPEAWIARYVDPRWPGQKNFLMLHTDSGCVFLSLDGDITRCDIHSVRPSCCSEWQAGSDKPECREGMARTRE